MNDEPSLEKLVIVQYIIMISAGILIAVFGALIRFRGELRLLAGYDETKVRNRDGLQRFAGRGVIMLGGILIAGGIVAALMSRWDGISIAVFAGAWLLFVLATFRLVVGARRYSE